jgi:hypothetical protein
VICAICVRAQDISLFAKMIGTDGMRVRIVTVSAQFDATRRPRSRCTDNDSHGLRQAMINVGPCYLCKATIWLPDGLYRSAKHSERISFWCAFGHEQHFAQGESDEQKLRRERDLLTQRLAEKDDEIRHQCELREGAERQLTATRGVVTRIKNRIGHGVCPCCNRTFGDLSRHMATKHPTYGAEAAE